MTTLTNPLSAQGFMEKGMSKSAAKHEANKFVFGADYKKDRNGNPIEQGVGTPRRQTQQHKAALEQTRVLARKYGDSQVGYTPALADAFDPKSAPAARKPRGRKPKTAAGTAPPDTAA